MPKLKTPRPSEHETQAAILEYLQRVRGIFCWRNNSGAFKIGDRFIRTGKVGSSDIIGILPDGRFLAIEVKAHYGKVSPEQQTFIDTINANGGLAFVAFSVGDVMAQLDFKQNT